MANWFVRPLSGTNSGGGTGTGTSWTNAWLGSAVLNGKWGSINPGDTIWFSAGSYAPIVIGGDGSSGNQITLQRAIASDPAAITGSGTGWLAAYDGQVVVTASGAGDGININHSFITIDGRTLQGIQINYGNVNGGNGISQDNGGSGFAGGAYQSITLRHILCFGPGVIAQVGTASVRGISFSQQQGINGLTIQFCETANGGSAGVYITTGGPGVTNCLVEHCLFHDAANGSTGGGNDHPNALFLGAWTNCTFRYNKIYGIEVEGLFFGYLVLNTVYIYGNVIFQGSTAIVARNSGRGIEFDYDNTQTADPASGTVKNVFVYNNTFVDFPGATLNFHAPPATTDGTVNNLNFSGCVAENNLNWNTGGYSFSAPGTSHDHNFSNDTSNAGGTGEITGGAQPFVNYIFESNSADFHIIQTVASNLPKNKGVALADPGTVGGVVQTLYLDFDGVDRRVTGNWSMGAYELAAAPAGGAVATMVQHVSTGSNNDSPTEGSGYDYSSGTEPGNPFWINLPNLTLSGNALTLGLTIQNTIASSAVSDDQGNAWTLRASINAGGAINQIWTAFNIKPNTMLITVTFDSPQFDFQADVTEWNNVIGFDVATTSSSSTSPNVNSGAMTTTASSDLIYNYAFDTHGFETTVQPTLTNVTPGTGYTLLSGCLVVGHFSQFTTQTSAGSITPSATITTGSDSWNSLSVALKTGTAGAARPSTMRIVRVYHSFYLATRTTGLIFPTTGNLIFMGCAMHHEDLQVNTPSDNVGNTWTLTNQSQVGGQNPPQSAYAQNATPSATLKITPNIVSVGFPGCNFVLYDIQNAAASAFDSTAGQPGGSITYSTNANFVNFPSITPSVAGGIVFAVMTNNFGPTSHVMPIAGQMLDSIVYGGETDQSILENADGYMHYYNPDTTTVNVSWTPNTIHFPDTSIVLGIAFKPATGGPSTINATVRIK